MKNRNRKLNLILTFQNQYAKMQIEKEEFKMKNEFPKLIFKIENEKSVWICSCCGAKYYRDKNWIPPTNYCMKCHAVWINL